MAAARFTAPYSASFAAPGSWLGVLGGGQLGRMFCQSAQQLGYRVAVLDPDVDSPAGRAADRHLVADHLDAVALDELAALCAAVTTEFENVPAEALERLATRCFVAPSAACVAIAQDRVAEKRFIESIDAVVAPWAAVDAAADIDALPSSLFPGILKRARFGYDGKGQARVADRDQARAAFEQFGRVPCVLEQRVALAHEISVIAARGHDGETVAYPAVGNVHRDGILAVSTLPAQDIAEASIDEARAIAMRVAERLDYVGVLCVEFFITADARLLVNEMAPRPHNSGHPTIEAAVSSQFEQQVRAMARLPLASAELVRPAVMLNLLGDLWFAAGGAQRDPDWRSVLQIEGAALHLYGKAEPRPGRKMGHLTCTGATLRAAREVAGQAASVLGLRL
ncbi:5-(carboxyamino)imidazole ribonucleotide synthase [soil metagenome]